MTRISQRHRTRATYGELDEIVAQLFNDLAAEDSVPQHAVTAATRNGPAPRHRRRQNDRSIPGMTVAPAPSYDVGMRLGSNGATDSQLTGSQARVRVSGELDTKQPFLTEAGRQDYGNSFTLEEEKFIKHAVAWLAPRPNANQLVKQLGKALQRSKAAAPPEDLAEKQRGDGSPMSQATAEGKPPAAGKRA